MKREYTMSKMNLIVSPTTVVCAVFHGDQTFVGPLSALGQWAKDNNAGVLRSCTIDDERYGLFPCLVATNERIAAALSVYSGYKVAFGDGRSFFTRADALACYHALSRAGVPVSASCHVWAITDRAYDIPMDRQPNPVKPQLESTKEADLAIFG